MTRHHREPDGSTRIEHYDEKRKAARVIIDYNMPVFKFAGNGILPGDYVIPV
jgi:hypothetical protein